MLYDVEFNFDFYNYYVLYGFVDNCNICFLIFDVVL